MWKVKKVVSKGDYNYTVVKDHPRATKKGYVLEHIIVIENHLGRLLNPNEVVHHIDGIKNNNIVSNLEVMSRKEHAYHHSKEMGRKYCILKCPNCGIVFEKPKNRTQLNNKFKRYTSCSRECSGEFSRQEQLHGLTHEMEKAITENIQNIYTKFLDDPVQTVLQQDA